MCADGLQVAADSSIMVFIMPLLRSLWVVRTIRFYKHGAPDGAWTRPCAARSEIAL